MIALALAALLAPAAIVAVSVNSEQLRRRVAGTARRGVLLWLSLMLLVPGDAFARAGGGTRSFRSPGGGGGFSGRGRGFGGGHHFFFFGGGGGGGGGLLLIIIVIVLFVLITRGGRGRRT